MEKLFLPQALSEKTDAPELGVCVIQVSTANDRFGSVPATGKIRCLFVNHSLLTQTVILYFANFCDLEKIAKLSTRKKILPTHRAL